MGKAANQQGTRSRSSRRHFLAWSAGLGLATGFGLGRSTSPAYAASGAYDVKTYGATGNGTTDDAGAIQKALDAAVNGGVVTMAAGTYRVTRPLRLGDRTTLQMTTQTTILRDF